MMCSENTKIMGIRLVYDSPLTMADVVRAYVYEAPASNLLRWYRFLATKSPMPVQPPSYVIPHIIRQLIIRNKHLNVSLNGAGAVFADCKGAFVFPTDMYKNEILRIEIQRSWLFGRYLIRRPTLADVG